MDGIYYDGINFDRRSFRRVRKVLDRASEGKKFAPLIDIHTGDQGVSSPSAVSYLSHFPYADSAWNGEGACRNLPLFVALYIMTAPWILAG